MTPHTASHTQSSHTPCKLNRAHERLNAQFTIAGTADDAITLAAAHRHAPRAGYDGRRTFYNSPLLARNTTTSTTAERRWTTRRQLVGA
eukprot:7276131-Prymnesium_polylepis.1